MSIELRVPAVGESITEVVIGEWLKAPGQAIARDEPLVRIETDKVTVELPAPTSGVLERVLKSKGASAVVGEVIGAMKEGPAPAMDGTEAPRVMPAAARVLGESGVPAASVVGTGPGGRVLKEDALRHVAAASSPPAAAAPSAAPVTSAVPVTSAAAPPPPPIAVSASPTSGPREEITPMSPLRRRVAERLVASQSQAALLTTFNEVDMSEVMRLRNQHKEAFLARHGVKLGFMSFFIRATVEALRAVPVVNSEIRGTDIVTKRYYDIGVAVGGGKGLVVPVLRQADTLGFAAIEKAIADFAARAQASTLKLEELQGGTFTISNGGVYGSLLSTPIVNPPQSGILGMHAIQERPVVVGGAVVARPMMYIALTYDHRLVDGREAVVFLKRIKECVEDPSRLLLDL